MALQIYNTLSGQKETFEPMEPGKLTIYVCGPTVYDMSHLGHARVYVAFDSIIRYLRRGYEVTHVRNFTDVDDKIIKRANEIGEDSRVVSERFIGEFEKDMGALGVQPADVAPKVTEHIQEIIDMVQTLIEKGIAYAVDGDVYYSVEKFGPYGKLGRRKLEDMEAGARVDVDDKKQHPMDFALWKAVKPGEPSWDAPWGKGRPGWHIECSAMSGKYLGKTFDIHGGGKDLIFPHHENEIAQSEAANGATFVRYWMHNGFVNIDDEKMSKSLGNFFTVRDILEKYDPLTIRYYLLRTHYRSPINFSDAALDEAAARVKRIYESLQRIDEKLKEVGGGSSDGPYRDEKVAGIVANFCEAMDDDFNTAKAIGDVEPILTLANDIVANPKDADTDARTLRAIRNALDEVGQWVGLFTQDPVEVLESMAARRSAGSEIDAAEIESLIEARKQARADKDFAKADQIRNDLQARGVVLKDSPTGTTWEVA